MFTGTQNEPQGELCPRCENHNLHSIKTMNALSHSDNETHICKYCAVEESDIYTGLENSQESQLRELAFKSKLKKGNTEELDREKLVSEHMKEEPEPGKHTREESDREKLISTSY